MERYNIMSNCLFTAGLAKVPLLTVSVSAQVADPQDVDVLGISYVIAAGGGKTLAGTYTAQLQSRFYQQGGGSFLHGQYQACVQYNCAGETTGEGNYLQLRINHKDGNICELE